MIKPRQVVPYSWQHPGPFPLASDTIMGVTARRSGRPVRFGGEVGRPLRIRLRSSCVPICWIIWSSHGVSSFPASTMPRAGPSDPRIGV